MHRKIGVVLLAMVCGGAAVCWAASQGVWVGRQFRPEQCLEIAAGRHEVKRKLCTIAYDIQPKNGRFEVNARLEFDKTFIPDKVSHVELEVLLIDRTLVCSKQLDLRAEVRHNQVNFSFTADGSPSQRYVRTYYIIYYRQPT